MATPWTSYDFDPEAGDGKGAYTFSDGKTSRTVANTAFAAQLAADIDAASGKSRGASAEPFGGAAPPPDPMAGMARAEQAAAARVAPEWQPAQAALTGSALMPDPMAGMAAVERVLAARSAPAARPDPGAGLAPEAAQAARAIGTAPPPIDMDAIARRLEAIGKRPEPAAVTAAPAVGLAAPDDRMALETGYRKQGPFDFRRFLVDGPAVPLASMPEPLVSQAPPPAPAVPAPPPAPAPAPAAPVGVAAPPSMPLVGREDAAARVRALPAAVTAGDVDTVKRLTDQVVLGNWRGKNDAGMVQWGQGLVAQAEAARERNAPQAPASAPAATPPVSVDPSAMQSVDPAAAQSAQASRDYQATATAAQMAKPPAPSAVRVGGPSREDPNIALIRARGAEALGFQDRQNAVDQEKSAGMAGFQEEIAIKAAENADALAKLRENQQREERALLGERNQAAQEVFAKQYDPDRFWKQRPAAGLLATIAVALGELGRGLQRSNGPNIGLTLVNQAIERDLDAQREEYGRAKDKLGIKNNAYAELRAKGLTDQQAMSAAHAQQLSLVDQRIKLFTANSDNEQMKLRGDQLRAGIQNETVDKERQYRDAVARQAAQAAWAAQVAREKAEDKRLDRAEKLARIGKLDAEAGEARAKDKSAPDPERLVGLPNGEMVEVKNPTLQTKLAEASPEMSKFGGLVDDVVTLSNDPESRIPGTAAHAKLQSAKTDLELTLKGPAFANLGVLAGPDLDMIRGVLPDASGVMRDPARKALQSVKQRAFQKFDNTVRASGARKVQNDQYQDEQGNVRYATRYAPGTAAPTAAPSSLRRVGE